MCDRTRMARSAWLAAATICSIVALLMAGPVLTAQIAPAQEMMRDRPANRHPGSHRGGGGFATDIGIGIGGAVIDHMLRQQKQGASGASKPKNVGRKKGNAPRGVSQKKKKNDPGVAKKKGDPTSTSKKDDPVPNNTPPQGASPPAPPPTRVSTPPEGATPPGAPPTYVSTPVPPFPPVGELTNCRDCQELWRVILRYEKIIADDTKKLEQAEKDLEQRKQMRQQLVNLKAASGSIDRAYYDQLINNLDERIGSLSKQNDDLRDLIEREIAELALRKELYQKCVDAHCSKQVTETPTEPPPNPPVVPPHEPPAPPTKVVTTPREPPPSSAPPANPCPDHHAELTNGNRVFHRLYVLGPPDGGIVRPLFERVSWSTQMDKMRATLESPGRQAPRSTSSELYDPKLSQFDAEMRRLQKVAKACEEVTIILFGHGAVESKSNPRTYRDKDGMLHFDATATFLGSVQIGEPKETLYGDHLDTLVKGFGPHVSVTIFAHSCYGGAFGGKGNVEQSELVQVIGSSGTLPSLDVPCRTELSEDFMAAIDNAANAMPNGRATAREVNSHLQRSGWPMGAK